MKSLQIACWSSVLVLLAYQVAVAQEAPAPDEPAVEEGAVAEAGEGVEAADLVEPPLPVALDPSAPVQGYVQGCTQPCDGKHKCYTPCYGVRGFGEYLFLRARDAEQPFAVQVNSQLPAGIPAIQTSPIALVDPDYSSGVRAGFGVCLSNMSELVMSYTHWESDTQNNITRDNPNIQAVRSLVIHPGTRSVVTDTVSAAATLDMQYDLIDADFRKIFYRDCTTDLSYTIGLRYGEFHQDFSSLLTDDLASATNDTELFSNIDFYGAGVRLGLEGEHYARCLPMMFYMKGFTSLLAGEMHSSYQQTVQANSNYGVNTSWRAGRVVPTFDLELGTGFYTPGGTFRVTAGYMFSAWSNMLKQEDWIDAVQANNYTDMSGVVTLDGLVFRVEGRF